MTDNQNKVDEIQTSASARGGKRKGAGRPSLGAIVTRNEKWFAARGINPLTAAEILASVCDERKVWRRLLTSDDDRVVLQSMVYLTSMRDGKPSQQINVTSTNFTLKPKDIEQAREIIREIRGERTIAASYTSPLTVDAASDGACNADVSPRLGEGTGEELAKPILRGDEGGN